MCNLKYMIPEAHIFPVTKYLFSVLLNKLVDYGTDVENSSKDSMKIHGGHIPSSFIMVKHQF